MQPILEAKKEALFAICSDLKVERMYAFGSILSANFREESDIDFLISFPENLSIEEYTENYFALHYKLRELFNRNVDIVTERALSNPYFIQSINETKELIYAA